MVIRISDKKQNYSNVTKLLVKPCIIYKNQTFLHVETTDVYFKKLTEQDIISYVNSGKCMDKAGSYGIQECDFVDHIEGDYTNVVGLPKYVVESIMKDVALQLQK